MLGVPPFHRFAIRLGVQDAGHVCAVGSFGRTWIASIGYHADRPLESRKSVNVFHEARKDVYVDGINPLSALGDIEFSFYPQFVQRIRSDNLKQPVFLIGRHFGAGRGWMVNDVILADPDSGSVKALGTSWPFAAYGFADERAVYLVYSGSKTSDNWRYLEIREAPEFARAKPAILGPREFPRGFGEFTVDGDIVYLVQDNALATLDIANGKIVSHCALTPEEVRHLARLARSSHYGIVLYSDRGMWSLQLPVGN